MPRKGQALKRPTRGAKKAVPQSSSAIKARRVDQLQLRRGEPVADPIVTSSREVPLSSTSPTSPISEVHKGRDPFEFPGENHVTQGQASSPTENPAPKAEAVPFKRKRRVNNHPDSPYRPRANDEEDEDDDHVRLLKERRNAVSRDIGLSSRLASSHSPVSPALTLVRDHNILDTDNPPRTTVVDFSKQRPSRIPGRKAQRDEASSQREEAKQRMMTEDDHNETTLIEDGMEGQVSVSRDTMAHDKAGHLMSRLLGLHSIESVAAKRAADLPAARKLSPQALRPRQDRGQSLETVPKPRSPSGADFRPAFKSRRVNVLGPFFKDQRTPRQLRHIERPQTRSEGNPPVLEGTEPTNQNRGSKTQACERRLIRHVEPLSRRQPYDSDGIIHVRSTPPRVSEIRAQPLHSSDRDMGRELMVEQELEDSGRMPVIAATPLEPFDPALLQGRFDEVLADMTIEFEVTSDEALGDSHAALRRILERLAGQDAARVSHFNMIRDRLFYPLSEEIITIKEQDKYGLVQQTEELLGDRMARYRESLIRLHEDLEQLWARRDAVNAERAAMQREPVTQAPAVARRTNIPSEAEQQAIWHSGTLKDKEELLLLLTVGGSTDAATAEDDGLVVWSEYQDEFRALVASTERKLEECEKTEEKDQKAQRRQLLSLLGNL